MFHADLYHRRRRRDGDYWAQYRRLHPADAAQTPNARNTTQEDVRDIIDNTPLPAIREDFYCAKGILRDVRRRVAEAREIERLTETERQRWERKWGEWRTRNPANIAGTQNRRNSSCVEITDLIDRSPFDGEACVEIESDGQDAPSRRQQWADARAALAAQRRVVQGKGFSLPEALPPWPHPVLPAQHPYNPVEHPPPPPAEAASNVRFSLLVENDRRHPRGPTFLQTISLRASDPVTEIHTLIRTLYPPPGPEPCIPTNHLGVRLPDWEQFSVMQIYLWLSTEYTPVGANTHGGTYKAIHITHPSPHNYVAHNCLPSPDAIPNDQVAGSRDEDDPIVWPSPCLNEVQRDIF